MKKTLAGALLIVASAALLILMRVSLGPEEACEHNPSVALHGTFADCEARNPPPAAPSEQAQKALASR